MGGVVLSMELDELNLIFPKTLGINDLKARKLTRTALYVIKARFVKMDHEQPFCVRLMRRAQRDVYARMQT